MSLLEDQLEINENLMKAIKDLLRSMEAAKKCIDLLAERIRNLEERVDTRGRNGIT